MKTEFRKAILPREIPALISGVPLAGLRIVLDADRRRESRLLRV
jgi:hypothetical protein